MEGKQTLSELSGFADILDFIDRTWIGGSFLCVYPWSADFLAALRDDLGVPICGVHDDVDWIQKAKLAGLKVWVYNYDLTGRAIAALDGICTEHEITTAIVAPEQHGEDFPAVIETLYALDVKELYLVTYTPATDLPKLSHRYCITHFEEGSRVWHLSKLKGSSNL